MSGSPSAYVNQQVSSGLTELRRPARWALAVSVIDNDSSATPVGADVGLKEIQSV